MHSNKQPFTKTVYFTCLLLFVLDTDQMEMYANTTKKIPKGGKTNKKMMNKKIRKTSRPPKEVIPEDSASPEEVCQA